MDRGSMCYGVILLWYTGLYRIFCIHVHACVCAGADGETRHVQVTVQRLNPTPKPFIGGYRHTVTGVEYHNATAQTRPRYMQKSKVSWWSC